jgi:hypothetical protein
VVALSRQMDLLDRAKTALWKNSGLEQDSAGYVSDSAENLVADLTRDMIEADYSEGSGQEWPLKIRALHSSAALAANTFGRWKRDPARVKILGLSGFHSLRLEAKCSTGLKGTPPNLDVVLESSKTVVGIESKLLEPLTPKKPRFSPSYSLESLPQCEEVWWSLLCEARNWPPSHLDAAQLIKHYLGLRNQYQDGRQIYLVYLFWKPLNASRFPEYRRHEEEIKQFRSAVSKGSEVQFVAMDYLKLWDSWEQDILLVEHARILKERYCIEI